MHVFTWLWLSHSVNTHATNNKHDSDPHSNHYYRWLMVLHEMMEWLPDLVASPVCVCRCLGCTLSTDPEMSRWLDSTDKKLLPWKQFCFNFAKCINPNVRHSTRFQWFSKRYLEHMPGGSRITRAWVCGEHVILLSCFNATHLRASYFCLIYMYIITKTYLDQ